MLKPLFALIVAGGVAWFGYDALRDGELSLPALPSAAPIVQEVQDSADPAAAAGTDAESDPASAFRKALGGASDQAGGLLKLGEKKSRNIPEILGEQRKMGSRLAEIDALIASGTLPPELQPAVDAYTSGSASVRDAMEKAKAGFTHLDWEKVRAATEELAQGLSSLAEARRLSGN